VNATPRRGPEPVRALGLDLGGTQIKVAVLEVGGAAPVVVATETHATEAEAGPYVVVDRLGSIGADAVAAHGPVATIGLGVPGLFDERDGTIVLFPNLPGRWPGHPVRGPLSTRLGMPVALVNDARAFTLAESRLGAGAGASTVICVVLGTGVGGGLVIDGRLRFGPNGRAGEVGHQVVVPDGPPCGCGNRGCVEAVANAAALTSLGGRATAAEVVAAARDGERRALDALAVVAGHLGHGLANLVTVLMPDRIVVGGGIADAGELLLGPLRAEIARRSVLVSPESYRVVPAQLGAHAGAVGAALWGAERPTV
jgi:glucokinase